MGMPGWPDFAASTASIASARTAFAISRVASAAPLALSVMRVSLLVVRPANAMAGPG
jgi:hypothetical protein